MLITDFLDPDVKVIDESATIGEAAVFFIETGVTDAAVCNAKQEFIGVLSQGDLLRAAMPDVEQIYRDKVSYRGLNQHFLKSAHEKSNLSIEQCIIREAFTLLPEDSIVKAITIMINYSIGSLPVVKNKTLLGVVTRTKTLRLFTFSSNMSDV